MDIDLFTTETITELRETHFRLGKAKLTEIIKVTNGCMHCVFDLSGK